MQVGPDNLKIDKHGLDEEIIQQPELFYYASLQAADAEKQVKFLEESLEVLIADLAMGFRQAAEDEGKKPVETRIKAEAENATAVQEKRKLLRKAYYARDQAKALKESFQQRSYALKDLTQLHIANYYSSDSVSENKNHKAAEAENVKKRLADERKQNRRDKDE